MTDQDKAEFFERYAPIAIDQQQKYGIPASVTLSQMALESGFGRSKLSREGKNFFGVKAHDEYIRTGRFGYYSDDRPNEKFCHYSTVAESVQDHTRILMKPRYAACRNYDSTDYHDWLVGIKKAGYATDPNYVASNEALIRRFNLTKYDRMAIAQTQQQVTAQSQDNSFSVNTDKLDDSQAMLAKLTGSNNPNDWLAYMMSSDKNKDGFSLGSGSDLLGEVVGTLLSGIVLLGSQYAGVTDSEDKDSAQAKVTDETKIDEATLIERSRDGIDPTRAKQIASMNYDSQTAEHQMEQTYKLS